MLSTQMAMVKSEAVSSTALFRRLLGYILVRPRLLPLMARIGWRFRRRNWHRRWPFLPLPSSTYVAWRLHTAFGQEDAMPTVDQLENYLRWAHELTP